MKWDSENFKKLSHQRGKFRKKINKHKNKGCLINHIITISRIELTAENDLSEGGKGNSNPRLHFKLQLSEGEFLESNSLGHLSLRVPQLEVEGKWNLTAHSANGVIYGLVTVFVTDVSKLVWLVCSGKCFNKRVRFHIPNRTCELFLDRLWLEYSQMNNICIHCCHKFASKTLWYFHAPNASFAPYVL